MKTFVKIFRGKMSYTKIDKYVDLVRRTLDPDDYFNIEIQYDDGWQHIKIEIWDRVLHQYHNPQSLFYYLIITLNKQIKR